MVYKCGIGIGKTPVYFFYNTHASGVFFWLVTVRAIMSNTCCHIIFMRFPCIFPSLRDDESRSGCDFITRLQYTHQCTVQ